MKVNIGPHVGYLTPFHIAEKILFWKDKYKPNETNPLDVHKDYDDIHNLALLLEKIPGLLKLCAWYSNQERKVIVRVDQCDTWSADNTIALLVVPLLKQLKENKHSAGGVDDDDVPEELKSTSAKPLTEEEEENSGSLDDNYFKRWDWALDEMIWAFEQSTIDWENEYYSGESDIQFEKTDDGLSKMVHGPNHTFKVNREGVLQHQERMYKGRMLFAKYYESLWS
jgi:hypothetical protein